MYNKNADGLSTSHHGALGVMTLHRQVLRHWISPSTAFGRAIGTCLRCQSGNFCFHCLNFRVLGCMLLPQSFVPVDQGMH